MDLRQLEVFVSAVRFRSFSRAAEALRLTQSTVSEHIRLLEAELGARLFDRVGRETVPTRAAELLSPYARRLLALRAEAQQTVGQLSGHLAGELAIGASTIPSEYVLPPLMGRFRDTHPAISIQMRVADTRGIVQALLEGEIELGVVGARPASRMITIRELMPDELVVILPPDHRWRRTRRLTLEDLRAEPIVVREAGSGSRASLEQALDRLGVRLGDLRVVAEMGSTGAVKQAVKAGLGISVVSRRAVEEECRQGVLATATVTGLRIVRHFYVVTHAARSRSPLAQAFLALLETAVTPGSGRRASAPLARAGSPAVSARGARPLLRGVPPATVSATTEEAS